MNVSPTPAAPRNPRLLVIDTSVLMQLIVSEHVAVLKHLKSDFAIQPTIVPAVESEALHLTKNGPAKFRGRETYLKKALANRALATLSSDLLDSIWGNSGAAWIRQIDQEGHRLAAFVDRGEAFTHAASMVLNVPGVTNDFSAVNVLLRRREQLPQPILRFWDLIVFGHQSGTLDEAACDKVRKSLHKAGERLPLCFSNCSYRDGLNSFYCRLINQGRPVKGLNAPPEREDGNRMYLVRTTAIGQS